MQPRGASVSHMPLTAKFPSPRSQTARRAEVREIAAGHPNPNTGTTTARSTTGRTVHLEQDQRNLNTPDAVKPTATRPPGCPPCRTATTTGLLFVSRRAIRGPVWRTAAFRAAVHPRLRAPWCRCPAGPLVVPGGPAPLPPHLTSIYAPFLIHSLDR